jgi:hypothetical protein
MPVVVGELGQLPVALAPGGAGPEDALQPSGLAGAELQLGARALGVRPALT